MYVPVFVYYLHLYIKSINYNLSIICTGWQDNIYTILHFVKFKHSIAVSLLKKKIGAKWAKLSYNKFKYNEIELLVS